MAGFRVLADGRTKFSVLTTKPINPALPLLTELNAGIDASCKVLQDNFNFGPTDSDKIAEKALCSTGNSNSLGASNGQAGFTIWRFFATSGGSGGFDTTDDALFAAVKQKGSSLWLYARRTNKLATEAWAASDEIYYGAAVVTDTPQPPDGGGFIKYRVPCEVQDAWPFITVPASA